MKNVQTRWAVLLLSSLGFLTGAYGQITPLGDSYINTAAATTNYGTKTTLDVENAQTSFIQFNLSSIPSGYTSADITKATLKLYVNAVTTAGSFNVDYVNGTWTEGTIDASNAPALGTTIAASVPLTTADKNQYILVDVTAAVQSWLNGTPNDGIALVANSPLNASFDSKESTTTSHAAELDIVFAGGGSGTITGVNTASGSGLTGGGTSGTLNLSLLTSCSSGQVLAWNGSAWVCAATGTGTVTAVGTGTGLLGGPITTSGTLTIDPTIVPQLGAANTFTGNQTVNGNLSATGTVTGGNFQIGSNLFGYGSYANKNAFLGFAGNTTTTGLQNTATGVLSLSSNTTGDSNTAIGYDALLNNTAGNSNVAVGTFANFGTTSGTGDVAVGASSLTQNSTGSNNTAIGEEAGQTNGQVPLTGGNNTALGAGTLFGSGTLTNATAVGANAEVTESNAMVLGNGVNVGIGTTAPAYSLDVHGTGNFTGAVNFGSAVTFASGQTFPGTGTITGVTTAPASGLSGGGTSGNLNLQVNFNLVPQLAAANIFTTAQTIEGNLYLTNGNALYIGSNPFAFGSIASANVLLGFAGNSTMTGGNNTAVGFRSLFANGSGQNNTASGYAALIQNTTGIFNTADGVQSLFDNTSGEFNTALGNFTLPTNTSGGYNTAVGDEAGSEADGSSLVGSYNTAVGTGAIFSTGTLNNATAIGASSEVAESNALVLGSIKGVNNASASISVGIGTTTPGATLDVRDNGSGGATISATTSAVNNAVYGSNSATSGTANGAAFYTASPQGTAVVGVNTAAGGGYAGYFQGNVYVSGSLSKGSGSFQIDHPLDPANKYLYHSFVESPDMMNVYNGNVVTNQRGVATVALPDYFEALNQDFRYQLTVIGQFAQAIVAQEISNNRFTIKTNKPGVKVSWQVTGIRHDAYADAHRIGVEVEKPQQEQGRYLHPELFGAGPELAIGFQAPPVLAKPAVDAEAAHVTSLKKPAASLK